MLDGLEAFSEFSTKNRNTDGLEIIRGNCSFLERKQQPKYRYVVKIDKILQPPQQFSLNNEWTCACLLHANY